MKKSALPRSLAANPLLSHWISFHGGRVQISTGKVELGQGILTALVQIAAEELCVDITHIDVISGETPTTPDEIYTAGSQSVALSGGAIRLVCANVRSKLIALAKRHLRFDIDASHMTDGHIVVNGRLTGIDYWSQIDCLNLDSPYDGTETHHIHQKPRYVGRSVPRIDLSSKIFGSGFIHDMTFEGMKHARVLRGAFRHARLAMLDEDRVRRVAPVDIVRIKHFTALVANRERDAEIALNTARVSASWTVAAFDDDIGSPEWLRLQDTTQRTIQIGAEPQPSNSEIKLRVSRPFLSHGSIGLSCAIACFQDGKIEIWTHSQGVGPLRAALAEVLEMEISSISVMHRHGAGCYGHNGADDAACDAALIALRYPGTPIRVLWSRSDELSVAPLGAAMTVEASASLAEDLSPKNWKLEIWSGSHGQRPGMAGRANLLAAEEAGLFVPGDVLDVPDSVGGGGTRNAISPYELPGQTVEHHLITQRAPHTSALRGLGTQVNVIAIEGLMDELAKMAGVDPLEYRLRHLSDNRARNVLQRCADICDWAERGEAGTGTGLGIAYSRYKNQAARLAVAARVEIDEHVHLSQVWCVADAGLLINPDGARNQIEGGIVQAASWTLKESFVVGNERTVERGWADYPIMRFSEMPKVMLQLLDKPTSHPLGIGEAAVGPASAAIANAIAHALDMRIGTLPFTRENLETALLAGTWDK